MRQKPSLDLLQNGRRYVAHNEGARDENQWLTGDGLIQAIHDYQASGGLRHLTRNPAESRAGDQTWGGIYDEYVHGAAIKEFAFTDFPLVDGVVVGIDEISQSGGAVRKQDQTVNR